MLGGNGLMDLTPQDVLDVPIYEPDSGAISLRNYLKTLLKTLWDEADGFSGKRPFGNSGWQWSLAKAMVEAGIPVGTLDADGYLEDVDPGFDVLILDCIESL